VGKQLAERLRALFSQTEKVFSKIIVVDMHFGAGKMQACVEYVELMSIENYRGHAYAQKQRF